MPSLLSVACTIGTNNALIRPSAAFNSVVAIHELPLHSRFEIPVH